MPELRSLLAIDVGGGTQDILLYQSDRPMENCVKLILPSQTNIVANRIQAATAQGRPIFLTGNIMGGGPSAGAIRRHIQAGLKVYATAQAALTFHDNLEHVRQMGVGIVGNAPPAAMVIRLSDVDLDSLRQGLALFDVALPQRTAIAVQDHGHCPVGSNRAFRFRYWQEFVEGGGQIAELAYLEAPRRMTRMRAVQTEVPGAIVMDTGAAAIWGALCDPFVAAHSQEGVIIANIGNQHTLGALLQGRRMWGLFEHHTARMTPPKLANYIARLRAGTLSNEEVFQDDGHGCSIHPQFTVGQGFRLTAVSGPNRQMARDLGYYLAVPYGDMMLAGCFGLVAASRELLKRS
ncbi:MAG: DUF1786 domain-containing protein [Chloroflexi bacterium]|nr:DUF1786 domain-containing protein [Chloroflexota bacterium]